MSQSIRAILEAKRSDVFRVLEAPDPLPVKPKPIVRETADMRAASQHPIQWATNIEIHVYSYPLGHELNVEMSVYYDYHQRAKNEKLHKLYGENSVAQFQLSVDNQWVLEDVHAFIRQKYSNWRSLLIVLEYANKHPQYQEACRVLRVRFNQTIHDQLVERQQYVSQFRAKSKVSAAPVASKLNLEWPFNM